MKWILLRWVWQLEAPLFVGMPPAGALNRCKPYVPARSLWGSVTAEISRSRNSEGFPDYGKLGSEIALNCRFTYLFPAEKRGDKFLAWLPKFKPQKSLQWELDGTEKSLSDRDFRRRLMDSRPGTAIAPESDSAAVGTLRETECINTRWRDSNHPGDANTVLLLGYVFLRNNGFRGQLDNIDTLFVGGDTRYGLGKICRVEWHEASGDLSVFGKQARLDRENPEIQSDIVWGHALEDGQTEIHGMYGAKELLGGWDRGSQWRGAGALMWAPGSFLERTVAWSIDNYGYWMHQDNK